MSTDIDNRIEMFQTLEKDIRKCALCSNEYKEKVKLKYPEKSPIFLIFDKNNGENNEILTEEQLRFITRVFKTLGFSENEIYITTLVKCINLKTNEKNKKTCYQYIDAEISILLPSLIITFGEKVFTELSDNINNSNLLFGSNYKYMESINLIPLKGIDTIKEANYYEEIYDILIKIRKEKKK